MAGSNRRRSGGRTAAVIIILAVIVIAVLAVVFLKPFEKADSPGETSAPQAEQVEVPDEAASLTEEEREADTPQEGAEGEIGVPDEGAEAPPEQGQEEEPAE
jgi:cell division protein FtsN